MLMFLTTALSTASVEAFLTGCSCAITLYCGKTPLNRRKNRR